MSGFWAKIFDEDGAEKEGLLHWRRSWQGPLGQLWLEKAGIALVVTFEPVAGGGAVDGDAWQ